MSTEGNQSVEKTDKVLPSALVNTFERPLDPKKRLTIPSVWRRALGSDYVYVMKEEGQPCLLLIPKGMFESRLAGVQEEALTSEDLNDVLESVGEDSELLEFDRTRPIVRRRSRKTCGPPGGGCVSERKWEHAHTSSTQRGG